MNDMPPPGKRISVRGSSAAGKSTLGKELARRLDLPYVELDGINHQPNWKEIETEEFRRRVGEIVAQDGWVIDGNYARVRDLIFERCDTVIWLDYSLPVILWRLTRRIFRRSLRQEVLWNGNRERFWWHFFSKESLYLWVLTTHRRRRGQADEFFASPELQGKTGIRFRRPSEAKAWLESVPDRP
ncbi:shikimate kinase [Fimbriimonas ginsengisoli]|uniref:shikimate kinase n=1 Tax=Fimbriimonas ginsengisoli TaxID=1005039 RepID=UPI00046D95B0|nr:shikimate kinase [Fimbriimonas ginsengisoli]